MAGQVIGGLHEQEANSVIADWLNDAGRGWRADAERTGALADSNDRPDIIIRQGDRMPVIIECEYGSPAVGDAAKRLGRALVNETRAFTEVVAVGIADVCRGDARAAFRQRLDANERIFTIQLVSGDSAGSRIWPDVPMPAAPSDLAAYCEYAQVPQAVIDRKSRNIAQRVESAGMKLHESIRRTANLQGPTLQRLREVVGCERDDEAARTACAIWLIAIDLQNDLAVHSTALQNVNMPTTQALRENNLGVLLENYLLDCWRAIKDLNYLPVMELAIDSLRAGEMGTDLPDVLHFLDDTSRMLNVLHAKHIYNFAGELWQRLVGDREERAAHYTKPETAELLATLSARRFESRTAEELRGLNLMDAACGTGTLIGAGERALRRLYALKGGRDSELHRHRMEERLIALDVNGIAGTLTAKRLTDLDVTQDYGKSKIAVVTHQAGSLSLLDPKITGITDYLGYGGVSATPGLNNEMGLFHISHGSVHYALMNPPFSRPRKGRVQATTGLDKLRRMAAKGRNGYTMSHGQAGLASDFGNLCNMRMAPDGVFAHVLPLTAAHAGSWKQWRAGLEKDFQDIVAIANVSQLELQSMSADTGMGEMLVVATKRSNRPSRWRPTEILCVNLDSAPATLAQGYAFAQEIAAIPAGQAGLLNHGNYTRITQTEEGFPWGAVGNRNYELSSVGAALLEREAYDPLTLSTHALSLPMATLGDLADTGPTHHLIGYPKGSEPIGAFEWTPLKQLATKPAQQSLWAADSKAQTTIAVSPTHGGAIIDAALAKRMATQRSRWFLSRNMRWTSQAIAVASTAAVEHGGRAWNALQNLPDSTGQCIALYSNSIFGGIVRNAYGQSTQAGRAQIQVGAVLGLPCPAFNADTPEAQHARDVAGRHFDRLSKLTLEPFAYCFRDENRHEIDSVVAEMLGLDPADGAVQEMLAHYRMLFAGEPNVNGRQKSILRAIAEYKP